MTISPAARRWPWLVVAVAAVAAAAVALASPARAVPGTWATWTASGGSGAYTGTGSAAGTGFPDATFASDTVRLTVPGGASTFLNGATAPGAVYGSSQGSPYLNIGTAGGDATSTTTLTFATPTPGSGWAFVLGDVDADQVQVSATDASGAAVPVSGLGFQGSFNYCNGNPLPGACGGAPGTDEPSWSSVTSTLRGNGPDTRGASGWFAPSAAIKTLTFRFSRITPGTPIFQLWLVSLAQPAPTPTPTPTATSSPTTPPTSTPTPTATSSPTTPPTSAPTPTPSPSASSAPASPASSPSPSPRVSRTLLPGPPLVPVTG